MNHKPGELLKMLHSGKKSKAFKLAGIKMSGKSDGKSNKLGHGGRAAQLMGKLKEEKLPGGDREAKAIVGIQARKAQAAPGQKNYHGKKAKHMKRSEKKEATHVHVHLHGFSADSGDGADSEESMQKSSRREKHMKRKDSMHKCKTAACKASHKKEKKARKFSPDLEGSGGEKASKRMKHYKKEKRSHAE